jgi:hypothetical protein
VKETEMHPADPRRFAAHPQHDPVTTPAHVGPQHTPAERDTNASGSGGNQRTDTPINPEYGRHTPAAPDPNQGGVPGPRHDGDQPAPGPGGRSGLYRPHQVPGALE